MGNPVIRFLSQVPTIEPLTFLVAEIVGDGVANSSETGKLRTWTVKNTKNGLSLQMVEQVSLGEHTLEIKGKVQNPLRLHTDQSDLCL
jgi:hypothetical protein